MHLNIIASVCVIHGLRDDYSPIYIWDGEKWQEVALQGLYIHRQRKRNEKRNYSMPNEEKRQNATACTIIQISISIGNNGNECVCLIQSTFWTSGFCWCSTIHILLYASAIGKDGK